LIRLASKSGKAGISEFNTSGVSSSVISTCFAINASDIADIITENKRKDKDLFEQFTRNEISKDEFAVAKIKLTEESTRLNRILLAANTENDNMFSLNNMKEELKQHVKQIKQEGVLSRPIIDMLIDKIYTYPSNKITIAWKYADEESVRA